MYVKKVSLLADTVLACIEASLNITDGEQVCIRPLVYLDNAGVPGQMIFCPQYADNTVEYNTDDRWVKLPVGIPITANGDYWIGIHAPDPASLTIDYEASGGTDRRITSGSTWSIETGAVGAGGNSPGFIYSLRAAMIGTVTATFVGRTTVGASNQDMSAAAIYLKKVTIPAGGTLSSVDAHLKTSVANVPSVAGVVMSDNGGVPGSFLHLSPATTNAVLTANTYRWFSFPFGGVFASATAVWIGLVMLDTGSIDLAYDTTGGTDGVLASASEAAAWTAGTQNYSIRASILDATLVATRYGASAFGASEQLPDSSIVYARPVIVLADGWAVGVEVGIKDVAGTTQWVIGGGLYANNAGAPGDLITSFGLSASSSFSFVTSQSDRWYRIPIFEYVTAGTYWIGVINGIGAGAILYAAGSSGDGYTVDAITADVIAEPGSSGTVTTATDRSYSSRLVVLAAVISATALGAASPQGTAVAQVIRKGTAQGSASASGVAQAQIVRAVLASGTASSQGGAAAQVVHQATVQGTASASGTAQGVVVRPATALGVASPSGIATVTVVLQAAIQGTASPSGSAAALVTRTATATGWASPAGVAAARLIIAAAAQGIASASASGEVTIAGTVTARGVGSASGIAQASVLHRAVALGTASSEVTAAARLVIAAAAKGDASAAGQANVVRLLVIAALGTASPFGSAAAALLISAAASGTANPWATATPFSAAVTALGTASPAGIAVARLLLQATGLGGASAFGTASGTAAPITSVLYLTVLLGGPTAAATLTP